MFSRECRRLGAHERKWAAPRSGGLID